MVKIWNYYLQAVAAESLQVLMTMEQVQVVGEVNYLCLLLILVMMVQASHWLPATDGLADDAHQHSALSCSNK